MRPLVLPKLVQLLTLTTIIWQNSMWSETAPPHTHTELSSKWSIHKAWSFTSSVPDPEGGREWDGFAPLACKWASVCLPGEGRKSAHAPLSLHLSTNKRERETQKHRGRSGVRMYVRSFRCWSIGMHELLQQVWHDFCCPCGSCVWWGDVGRILGGRELYSPRAKILRAIDISIWSFRCT